MRAMLIYQTPISVLPYGILYIGDTFKRNNFETKLLVNTFKKFYSTDDFIVAVNDFKPDIIGLSFATLEILSVYDLVKKIKENSNAIIISGGPHPSSRPEEVVEYGSDIAVIGEGELTVGELCALFTAIHKEIGIIDLKSDKLMAKLEKVAGVCFKSSNGKIIRTAPRQRNLNLNKLPMPDFSLLEREAFVAADGTLKGFNKIENGRGCPSQCTFCDRSVFGNKYVNKTSDRIVKDIIFLKENYDINDFYFTDDTFTINKNYVLEVCDRILRGKLDITWACATRVSAVDEKVLLKMKEAGCRRVIFGIESGDSNWLKRTKKGYSIGSALNALELTHKVNIETHVNLMYGFPWETIEHIQNQIDFVKRVKDKVDIFQTYGALIPYPNTEVFEEYKDEYDLANWWLKEKYQHCGQVIYQNVVDPYEVSIFYQRNLHDDTYVYEDYFFKFSKEYKKKIRELGFLLGRHNLKAQYKSFIKYNMFYTLGVLSRYVYECAPKLEKKLFSSLGLKNKLHEFRKIGEFIKK